MFSIKLNLNKKKHQLKYQLMGGFILTLIIPLLIIESITNIITLNIMHRKISTLVESNLTNNKEHTDLLIKNYASLLGVLSSDYQITDNLKKLNKDIDSKGINEISGSIKEKVYLASIPYMEIQNISVITKKGTVISYNKSAMTFNDNVYKPIQDSAESTLAVIGGTLPYKSNGINKSALYFARRISDLNSLEHLGTIIICIEPSTLNLIDSYEKPSKAAYSFITTSDGKIVAAPDSNYIGRNINDVISTFSSNKRLEQHVKSFNYLGWKMVYILDKSVVFHELLQIQKFMLIFTFLIFVTTVVISIIICNHFTKPIPKIINAMLEVQKGNFFVEIPTYSKNEFADIEHTLNFMIKRIRELMDENKKQFTNLLQATEKKKEAEIKALEAQINPHFLFNTLDSINWMAIENEQFEISLMLKNLAIILRYSISNSNKLVTVEDEIQWLYKYLYLQKQRFLNTFDYNIEAPKELYSYKIYKLLLQPIVENAILHGFEGYESGGILNITFSTFNETYLKITIEDNGVGISKEAMESISQYFQEDYFNNNGKSIGISNVIYRLRSYYGNEANLLIDTSNKHTSFILIIPV